MTESTENLTNEEEAPINLENAENNAEVNTAQSEEEVLDPQVQIDALNDKYLRLYAEFDNYKRRTAKERIELFKTANADVIKSMLSVLDDFDRAKKSMEIAKDIEATIPLWKSKGLLKSRRTHKAFEASAAIARGQNEQLDG